MNRVVNFLFNKAFYIGFFLSASLALFAYQLSSRSITELKTALHQEDAVRVILRVNYLLQRSLSTASTAMILDAPEVFGEALKVYNSGLSLLEKGESKLPPDQYKIYHTQLTGMQRKFVEYAENYKNGFKPSDKQFKVFAVTVEKVGMGLARDELIGWKNSVQNYSVLMNTQKKGNVVLKVVHFLLTAFLLQLMVVSGFKERAEKRLTKSEALHKTLFRSLNEAVILARPDGVIYNCNDACSLLMGIDRQKLLGRKITGILPHLLREDKELFEQKRNPILKALKEGEVSINKLVGFLTPNFESRWVNLSITPLKVGSEESESWIFSFSDMTDRVEAQRIIVDQQQSIISASKMSALGQMAGGIAHEINNPLAIIHAEAEEIIDIIEDEGNIEGDLAKSMAENIGTTVQRIAKIIRGLKTFSRDASEDPFDPVRIGSIVESVMGLISQKLKANQIELDIVDFDPDETVECRETQICQVIVNLIGNSLDAMEDAGLENRFVKLEIFDLGPEIEFAVLDAGAGISKDVQEKMLQPFFTTKDVGKGTGLGLSISRGIMEKHNGKLYIDNNCSNTRIALRFPKKHTEDASQRKNSKAA